MSTSCPSLTQTPGACAWVPSQLSESMANLGFSDLASYIAEQQQKWNNGAYPGAPTYCAQWQNEQLSCIQSLAQGQTPSLYQNPLTLNANNCQILGGASDANGNCTFPVNSTTNPPPPVTSATAGNMNSSTSAVAQTNIQTNTTNTTASQNNGSTPSTTDIITEDSLGLGLPNWAYAAIGVGGLMLMMEMGKRR